jgi:CheY-like chemotaxis protein
VLYIEDNLSNLTLVQEALAEEAGVAVVAAMQGRLGVELAREHRPGLILLDLHLPDMEGEAVLRELQGDARTAGIPVVVLSADAMPGQVAKLRAAGVREYLTKPLDLRRLQALVQEIVLEKEPIHA